MIRLWFSKLELIHYAGLNVFTLPPFHTVYQGPAAQIQMWCEKGYSAHV